MLNYQRVSHYFTTSHGFFIRNLLGFPVISGVFDRCLSSRSAQGAQLLTTPAGRLVHAPWCDGGGFRKTTRPGKDTKSYWVMIVNSG